ncbi:hypothetical protein AB0B25_26200 [Nocardia sp. NPDC049190]|uniref:hypothetical protein n=1 Tax=Nocardia sp. NPDC049190 TaxID=3155650 RepID=UPI00340E1B1C
MIDERRHVLAAIAPRTHTPRDNDYPLIIVNARHAPFEIERDDELLFPQRFS